MMGSEDEIPDVDFIRTRFISETLEVEGVKFSWWGLGKDPTFVTVSSPVFGRESGFTRDAPEAFARELAERVLRTRYGAARAGTEEDSADTANDHLTDYLLEHTDTVVLPDGRKRK